MDGSLGDASVVGFEAAACLITFCTSLYLAYKAIKSSTGPRRKGAKMRDYSGVFENDMVPVVINFTVTVSYFGSLMESAREDYSGFFHTYRYASYLFSCPLIVSDLVYSSGSPYRFFSAALTWFSLLIAFFADITDGETRWGWFALGTFLYLLLAYMLVLTLRRAMKISKSLSRPSTTHSSEAGVRAMKRARKYIVLAVSILFTIWPMFPVLFVLEHTGVITRANATIGYALLDIAAKSLHSYCVDKYKRGLLERLCMMGFLTPDVLQDVDPNEDIEPQLLKLMSSSSKRKQSFNARRRKSKEEVPPISVLNMMMPLTPKTPLLQQAEVEHPRITVDVLPNPGPATHLQPWDFEVY